MSLVDSPRVQEQRLKDALDVYRAYMALLTLFDHADEDVRAACARLQEWLDKQPQYVQDVLPERRSG